MSRRIKNPSTEQNRLCDSSSLANWVMVRARPLQRFASNAQRVTLKAGLESWKFNVGCWTLSMLVAAAGCDKSTPATASSLPAPTFGSSRITGQVRFLGTPPELKIIDTSKCHPGAKPALEESIVVGANQGLKDVIVYIKNAPASDGRGQPTLALDQQDCVFSPHVLAIQVNQTLQIHNSDPTFHNSHWVSEFNGDKNIGLAQAGLSENATFAHPEFIRIRCDVHAWMESWVGVFDHPFFATTARDGTFTIDKLPPGNYTVNTWHPILGEREQAVSVSDTGAATVTIEYAPPAK